MPEIHHPNGASTAKWVTGILDDSEWKQNGLEMITWQNNFEKNRKYKFESKKDKWIWFPCKKLDLENSLGAFYFRKTFTLSNTHHINSAKILITADEKFKLYSK